MPILPPITTRIWNFAKAVAVYTKSGLQKADKNTYIQRLALCNSCDKLIPETGHCSECGCPVNIRASWAAMECPLKKWSAVAMAPPPRKSCCGGK